MKKSAFAWMDWLFWLYDKMSVCDSDEMSDVIQGPRSPWWDINEKEVMNSIRSVRQQIF